MKLIKEQLQMYGASTLSTLELLAYLLDNAASHEDALMQAGKLLDTYNLSQLQTADWAEMTSHAGLSKAQAHRLNIICELARRLMSAGPDQRVKIMSSADAAQLLKPMMMNGGLTKSFACWYLIPKIGWSLMSYSTRERSIVQF